LAPSFSLFPRRGSQCSKAPQTAQGAQTSVSLVQGRLPWAAEEPSHITPPFVGVSLAVLAVAAALGRQTVGRAAAAEMKEVKEEVPSSASDEKAAELTKSKTAAAAKKKEPEVFDVTKQIGAIEPLGYWDPLNLCPLNDRIQFRKLRTAELKHGRVAMLASVGLVAQHFIRFPTASFEDVPSGIMAPFSPSGGVGCGIIVWVTLTLEFVFWAQDPTREIGDFGDPLNVKMYDDEMRNRELNNGRFAMFATMGILLAELATGKDAVQQLGF